MLRSDVAVWFRSRAMLKSDVVTFELCAVGPRTWVYKSNTPLQIIHVIFIHIQTSPYMSPNLPVEFPPQIELSWRHLACLLWTRNRWNAHMRSNSNLTVTPKPAWHDTESKGYSPRHAHGSSEVGFRSPKKKRIWNPLCLERNKMWAHLCSVLLQSRRFIAGIRIRPWLTRPSQSQLKRHKTY